MPQDPFAVQNAAGNDEPLDGAVIRLAQLARVFIIAAAACGLISCLPETRAAKETARDFVLANDLIAANLGKPVRVFSVDFGEVNSRDNGARGWANLEVIARGDHTGVIELHLEMTGGGPWKVNSAILRTQGKTVIIKGEEIVD